MRLSWGRDVVSALAVSLALVLQVSLFSHLSWHGVVPDLVLLVVVAAGLAHGTEYAMVLGFGGGLLLDLAPPADHVAGRWALALLVVGYVAGRLGTSLPAAPRSRVSAASAGPPASRMAACIDATRRPTSGSSSTAWAAARISSAVGVLGSRAPRPSAAT